jgi:multiple antibiotic resistance protein
LFKQSGSVTLLQLFAAVTLAWAVSAVILYSAPFLYKVLKVRGLVAMERLMGMLLVILSVQMFLDGITAFWHK